MELPRLLLWSLSFRALIRCPVSSLCLGVLFDGTMLVRMFVIFEIL